MYGIPGYNRPLAGFVLLIIVLSLRAFVLTDRGYRATNWARRVLAIPGSPKHGSKDRQPGWMV